MRFIGNDPNILDAFYKATADGSIAAGKPVIVTAPSNAKGSEAEFDVQARHITTVYDTSNDKVVIAYSDTGDSNYGKAVVGSVSGSSITFGTPVTFESASVENCRATFDSSNNKVLIVYKDGGNSNYGTAIVGTVSSDSISFGSAVVFYSAALDANTGVAFDNSNNKSVITYRGSSQYGNAIVATISGTTPSFGSPVVFESAQSNYNKPHFDSSNNKMLITYVDGGNSDAGTAIVGTVSGTSISFGSATVFESGQTMLPDAAFDTTANKFVVSFVDFADSQDGKARVATISGTSVSFGTVATFHTGAVNTSEDSLTTAYDASFNKTLIAFRDTTATDYSHYVYATIASGATTLTFSSSASFDDAGATSVSMDAVYDPDAEKVVLAWRAGNLKGLARTLFRDLGGKVKTITETTVSQAAGTPVAIEDSFNINFGAAYDSVNQKIVVAYRDVDNSSYGTAAVGTIDSSDNSISYGTPVVFESATTLECSTVYDVNAGKIVIFYTDFSNSQYGTAVVGTVSGTGISFGSPVTFKSATTRDCHAAYDSTAQKIVCVYQNSGTLNSIVGTVSGTSISFGSETSIATDTDYGVPDCVYDSGNNKTVVVYAQGSGKPGVAKVGTVSGTGISFGTQAQFESATTIRISAAYDSSAGKVVIAYKDTANSDYGTAIVGTVSGTDITFGTAVVFEAAGINATATAYDVSTGKIVIGYEDTDNSNYGTVITGTVSGTSISFDTALVIENSATDEYGIVYDANAERTVIFYEDEGDSNKGKSVVFQAGSTTTNLTTENYIGITDQAYTNGQDATVAVVGCIDRNQTSLTAGQQYFVQNDGTLSTTAGSPSVLAGTAISATELVVKE
tara:strand:+ start:13675 stop:16233 length:2559 start_codon:yes stop_codon:yes gene_type:complete